MKERNVTFSIKKSILALIGNVVIVDIFFLVLLSLVSIILENSQVRLSLDRGTILFIDITTTVVFSILQTFMILVVAYNWKSRHIKINKTEVEFIHGFWKIHTDTIPFSEVIDIVVSRNVVQELLNIGKVTFILSDQSKNIYLDNVERIAEYVGRLNAVKSIIIKDSKTNRIQPIEKLIEGGESDSVEFKSSIYYDYSTKQPNKVLTETI
ncbi:PH domain-containing protein, partial [Candidatus Dojkabacteria bacterium]|nr:PH domain-containing protein [Candidatus Dojkabacteria bacterium]